jgi:hypothetical protein
MDMADKDWLALVQDDVRSFVKGTFLEKSPLVPVSSKTGENLPLLIQELAKLSNEVSPKSSNGILRLPIDRVFTMKGFGTVITGTCFRARSVRIRKWRSCLKDAHPSTRHPVAQPEPHSVAVAGSALQSSFSVKGPALAGH